VKTYRKVILIFAVVTALTDGIGCGEGGGGSNADLSGIVVSEGVLQPVFASATTEYLDAPIPFMQTSASVTPTVLDGSATITVNGTMVASGSAYNLTNLPIGVTTATIVVMASDGATTKTYTVYLYRAVPVYKTGAGAITGYTLDPREDGAVQRGVAWPDPRFTDNGDGTINDNMTGLVWLKDANKYYTDNPTDPNDGEKNWADAITYCAGTFAGNSDWRLPNVKELCSLVHYGDNTGPYSWLNSQGFLNVQSNSAYWSSTTYAPNSSEARIVIMGTGSLHYDFKTLDYIVWPMRADSSGLQVTGQTTEYTVGDDGTYQKGITMLPLNRRFRDNGDGTITDNMTGLVWLKDVNPAGRKWSDAFTYVDTLNSDPIHNCGYADWRLPTINELETLIHCGQSDIAVWLNSQGFMNAQSVYWSSTTYARNTASAWYVNLDNVVLPSGKTFGNCVLPVREAR
jgi:hypothetical protein